jgi:hypothetical protein
LHKIQRASATLCKLRFSHCVHVLSDVWSTINKPVQSSSSCAHAYVPCVHAAAVPCMLFAVSYRSPSPPSTRPPSALLGTPAPSPAISTRPPSAVPSIQGLGLGGLSGSG